MVQFIGFLGSLGAAAMWWPQAVSVLRRRHDPVALRGVSLATYTVAVAFNALLLAYGLTHRAAPVVLAALGNLVCASLIVAVLVRSHRAVPA